MIHMPMGESYADRDHVQDIHPGGDLRLVPSRIDDDAFLLCAGIDVTVCLPGPYDNSFNHGKVKRKGMPSIDQYAS
jgi:hypothetical protein